jgi:hypothetical protein
MAILPTLGLWVWWIIAGLRSSSSRCSPASSSASVSRRRSWLIDIFAPPLDWQVEIAIFAGCQPSW